MLNVHLAPPGFAHVLAEELGARVIERIDDLFLVADDLPASWAQNTWFEAERLSFDSISRAAKHLRSIQRNWYLHSVGSHRRARLIEAALPPLKTKPLPFPSARPSLPLGSWCLLDPSTLLYAPRCASVYPDGAFSFVENKIAPPSRAYLKLWEFFTLSGRQPGSGERVLDLGSSPGGWTWVLDQTGCDTISVDKAPLAFTPSARVDFRRQSAFALEPREVGPVDWLFSDIICYPERLLELVKKWDGFARNFVCTIKFQGETDHRAVERFRELDGAEIRHLSCNKHELTFSRLRS